VERALATLSPKEKEILRLRFGIGEEGEHTLEEVGKRFSVTRERIRQIEAKALRKLRHPLRGRNLKAFIEKLVARRRFRRHAARRARPHRRALRLSTDVSGAPADRARAHEPVDDARGSRRANAKDDDDRKIGPNTLLKHRVLGRIELPGQPSTPAPSRPRGRGGLRFIDLSPIRSRPRIRSVSP